MAPSGKKAKKTQDRKKPAKSTSHGERSLLALAIMAAMVIQTFLMIPTGAWIYMNNREQAVASARQAWSYASDPTRFLSGEALKRLGERMMRDGLILGGMAFDASGHPVAAFGERPELAVGVAELARIDVQSVDDGRALDILVSHRQTGLAVDVIVRMASVRFSEPARQQISALGMAMICATLSTVLLALIVYRLMIVHPLRVIDKAAQKAIEDPDRANLYQLNFARKDQVGAVARSFDMLTTVMTVIFQEDLSAMRQAFERLALGVVQYTNEGRPIAANQAALEFFGVSDVSELRKRDLDCVILLEGDDPDGPGQVRGTLFEWSDGSDASGCLTIDTADGTRRALVTTVHVQREDGRPLRTYALYLPLDAGVKDLDELRTANTALQERYRQRSTEVTVMRRLLEACGTLLATSPVDKNTDRSSIAPAECFAKWGEEALRDGLISKPIEANGLPLVDGPADRVETAIRQALMLAFMTAGGIVESIEIGSLPTRDAVTLSVRTSAGERVATAPDTAAHLQGTTQKAAEALVLSAVRHTITQLGGRLDRYETMGHSAMIDFTLPSRRDATRAA